LSLVSLSVVRLMTLARLGARSRLDQRPGRLPSSRPQRPPAVRQWRRGRPVRRPSNALAERQEAAHT